MTAEEFKAMTVTQVFMGKVIGLTQGRISQLLDEGILIRDEKTQQLLFYESLKNYWLSKNVSEGVNFWKERGLHEKAKRELAELKLAKARGEVYSAVIVENAFLNLVTILRKNLETLPSKLSIRLANRSRADISEILEDEIRYALKEIAEYDLGELADEDD